MGLRLIVKPFKHLVPALRVGAAHDEFPHVRVERGEHVLDKVALAPLDELFDGETHLGGRAADRAGRCGVGGKCHVDRVPV